MRPYDARSTTEAAPHEDGGWSTPVRLAVVAAAYFAACRLGFVFREPGMPVSSVWPASGIAVAALLLNPPRLRLPLLTTFLLSAIVAGLTAGHRLAITASFMVANLLEAVLCAWLLALWGSRRLRFDRMVEVAALAAAAVGLNAVTAAVGTTFAVLLTGASPAATWLRWWISDGLGILVVTPLVVSWARVRLAPGWTAWPRVLEVVLFGVIFCPVAWLAFGRWAAGVNVPGYALFALLIWPALRFGQRGTTTAVGVIAVIGILAVSGGVRGAGPWLMSASLLSVQAFVAVAALSSFLLAASYAEAVDAAETARDEQVRLAAMSDHLPDGMVYQVLRDFDGRMRFMHVSAGVERLHGVTPADAMRDASFLYAQVLDEDRVALQAAEEESARTGRPLRRVFRTRRPTDGRIRWMQVSSSPQTLPDGRTRWDGVQVDVTDQQEAEREKDALREQLLQAQKMEAVGRLAGGVAHDFNNLLTVILGHVNLLEDACGHGGEPAADLAAVRQAAERAASLTGRLLAFSRKTIVAPRDVRVGDVLRGLEGMLRRLLGEDIELRVDDAASRAVRIDPGQLEQVLANLVVNARDAMPEGGRITVATADAWLTPQDPAVGPVVAVAAVSITVTDQGRGMGSEILEHLFEPFFTTKEAGKGTGLGLSTVHGIVTQAGGRVSATSEVGVGSVFTILLPAVEAPADGPHDAARREGAPGTETILLAEDDPGVRMLIASILSRRGYRVIEAIDGREALARCEGTTEPIALLVTDVVMPGLGGAQLAERVAELRPGIKVLLLSGYTEDSVARRDAASGAKPFLQKPFTAETLAAKVRQVLDDRTGA
jgi:PAS domain S-box-containing protein